MEQPNGPLRTAMRNILLPRMIRSVPPEESSIKVLIADRIALRILATALNINDLVREGISIIEVLDISREPLPNIPAIYFLAPNAESIEMLANEPLNMYKSYRIFFTSHLSDFLLAIIKKRAKIISRVKQFVELDLSFLAPESRVFSLDRPACSLPQVHARDISPEKVRSELSTLCSHLSELCHLLAPDVDWQVRSDATSFTTRTLAALLKEDIADARRAAARKKAASDASSSAAPSASSEASLNPPTKATVLVVDRISDLATPLVHEFTYQAMGHDLLTLNYRLPGGAHYEVEDEKTKEKKHELWDDEEKDPVWGSIRWKFIQEALQHSQDAFRGFVDSDAAFKIRGKATQDLDIKEMSAAVRALPDSQMKADKHALHIQVVRSCLETASELSLTDLALVEQDLVTGRAADSAKVKSEDMVERVCETLADERIPIQHRMRLLMLAMVVSKGLPGLGGETSLLSTSATFRGRMSRSSYRDALSLNAELSAAVEGMERLLDVADDGSARLKYQMNPKLIEDGDGMSAKVRQMYAARQAKREAKRVNEARCKRHGLEVQDDLQYDVARYIPPLRGVIMDLVDEELDEAMFPTTGELSVDAIIAANAGADLDVGSDSSKKREGGRTPKPWELALGKPGHLSLARGGTSSDNDDGLDGESRRTADPDHLYVVFVLGGVTYSEVRAMYEVCEKRGANVIIGGSELLTPKTFVRSLAAIADVVVRVQAMVPPLALELGVQRAAAQKRMAEQAKAAEERRAAEEAANFDEEFERERQNGEIVEVVTGYKKKRGFKFFKRKN